jgi:hypothetical protein
MWKYPRNLYVAAMILLAIPLLISPWPGSLNSVLAQESEGSGLAVSPTSLTFTARAGGSAPSAQSVSVRSSTTTQRNFTVTTSQPWLTARPSSGTTPATVSVSVTPTGLAAGSYTGTVRISVPNTEESARYVSVTFTVTSASASLTVSPSTLGFSYQQGGTLPSSQSLSVRSSTGSAVGFAVNVTSGGSWLSAGPASGTTPATVTVSVHPGTLAAGTYTGTVAISSSIGSVTVTVTLTITSTARLTVTPSSLAFGFQQGGSPPASQSLSVSSTTAASFTATATTTTGGAWLAVNPTSGATPATLTVSANPGTLAVGSYTGSIAVSSSLGSVTVPVTLTITASTGGGGGGHVLLAWSELGMHCIDGKDFSVLSILPPYNTIYAKLLTTGATPTEVTSGVTLTYVAIADTTGSINTTSAGSALSPYSTTPNTPSKTNFWTYVKVLTLSLVNPDMGLKGFPVQSLTPQPMTYGSMILGPTVNVWKAEGIPAAPYDDTLAAKPYPMVQITARDSSGNTLATATVVLAVSDEVSCRNCHAPNTNSAAMPSGGWINNPVYTADQNMRLNILKKHDDTHPIPAAVLTAVNAKGYTYQASLYQTALNGGALGKPVLCVACHYSTALAAVGLNSGVTGVNAMTADMHTLHARVTLPGSSTTLDNMTSPGSVGCYQCHPGPTTQCQRGAMTGTIPGSTAATCYSCHGNLSRVGVASRTGWVDEPNCQQCHQNGTTYTTVFTTTDIGPTGQVRSPGTDTTFATNPNTPVAGASLFRFSTGHGGVNCAGCHGEQHAEYPTSQPNDQVYSVHLQGYGGRITECSVCHGTGFATSPNGGPHGMHTVGSAWVSAHPNYAGGGAAACAYCHGSDFRGTSLSRILTTKTLAGRSFPAYHEMNCYDCHSGPGG